jgi:hypothetical protein
MERLRVSIRVQARKIKKGDLLRIESFWIVTKGALFQENETMRFSVPQV